MDAAAQYLFDLGENYRLAFALAFFFVGACFGSFLNVLIHRLPKNISLFAPRSHCPKCKKVIRWYDNLPLASYLVLRGKCRFCHKEIPSQYVLMELFSGLLLVFLFLYSGLVPELLWGYYLVSSLVVIAAIDFREMIIPDEITLTGICAAGVFAFLFPEILGEPSRRAALGEAVLGMVTGGGLIWITALIGDFVFKRESMGGGDLKLLAMIGAFLGVEGAIMTFFLAPFFALPFGLVRRWIQKTDVVPYGPFLALACVFNIFFADWLLAIIIGG